MIALLCFFLTLFASPFKSKSRLEAENAALRHQVIVLQRRVRGRVQLTNGDRLFLVQLYRWFPSILQAITIIRPETRVATSRKFPQNYANFFWLVQEACPRNKRFRILPVSNPRGLVREM